MIVEGVVVIVTLLAIGFLATRLAVALQVPHSVLLVILGLSSGLLLHLPRHAIGGDLTRVFPDVVLYVLLPPLVFEAAYNMDWGALRRDLLAIAALSNIALLISTIAIGAGLHLVLQVDLLPGLLFGALISATDPVAVVALFREVGAPRRLSTLVEGESLLNDGTAIVLFRVLTALLLAPATSHPLLTGLGSYLYVAVGGVAVGVLFIGVSVVLLRATSTSHSAQLGLSVAVAYLSFIVADHYLGVSGVMSTMTAGLYLGTRARLQFNREAFHGMASLWDFLALCANTLVFLMVGLEFDPTYVLESLAAIPPTLVIVYLARLLSVTITLWPLNRFRLINAIGYRYQAILVWGGLRGGLALALALVLPPALAEKPLFIALATAVVLSTLLINAVSIRPSLRALKLDRLNPVDEAFYCHSLGQVLDQVFEPLHAAARSGSLSEAIVEDVEGTARRLLLSDEVEALPSGYDEAFEVHRLLLDEQSYYNRRLEAEALSGEAWHVLTRSVSNRLAAWRQSGVAALREWQFQFGLERPRWRWMRRLPQELHQLTRTLEVLQNLDTAMRRLAQEHPGSDLVASWEAQARSQLDHLYRLYPEQGAAIQSQFVANTVAASAEHLLSEMADAEVISGAVYARAMSRVHQVHHMQLESARVMLNPSLDHLLRHVPLLRDVPEATIHELAMVAKRRRYAAGTVVVQEGAEGDSFFLVLGGLLEVQGEKFKDLPERPRFFPGSYFGEMSLLFGIRRSATVVAVLPSEVAELDRFTFETLMANHSEVAEAVRQSAWHRLNETESEV